MNLQRKDDLEKLHEEGCHDMPENELCTSESSTHIIRVNFPATQVKNTFFSAESHNLPSYHDWEYFH